MSGEVDIREARAAEAGELAALIREAFAPYNGVLSPPTGAHAETAASVAKKLDRGVGLVAEVAGQLVGAVFISWHEDSAYFDRLAVSPPFWGQGIATQLVAAVEQRARSRRLSSVSLRARIAQPRNVGYFERLGYVECSRQSHPEADGDVYVLLRKSIATDDAV